MTLIWTSPDNFEDAGGDWVDEPKAYDGNDDDANYAETTVSATSHDWSPFLVLVLPSTIKCDRVKAKFYTAAWGNYFDPCDIDVYSEDAAGWIDVYSGAWDYDDGTAYCWQTKTFAAQNISKIRARGWVKFGFDLKWKVNEVYAGMLTVPPPKAIGGQLGVGMRYQPLRGPGIPILR
jgi:hypothetical protein